MSYEISREEMHEMVARFERNPLPVSGDEAQAVLKDVAYGTSVKRSKVTYTPAMLEYRRKIEEDVAKMPPGTMISASDL